MMKQIGKIIKKELMLTLAVIAALISLIITPPSRETFSKIDWRTLGTLFMMLTVLEAFKKENIFQPIMKFSGRFKTMRALSLFLVFGVFFTSMFVTNDVSLLIFVPLTITLFRYAGREQYILPVLTFENIAAIRGSLLMPFGSPQNLFIYSRSGVSVQQFILHMSPLFFMSGALLICFICFLYRKDPHESARPADASKEAEFFKPLQKERAIYRRLYLALFAIVLATIVTRTEYWPYVTAFVALSVFFIDRKIFLKTDYVLLLTFLCFFVFSASITENAAIADVLKGAVAENEYWWGILLSQLISNVPASIVLFPFSTNVAGLLYGVDTAGLCSIIGSLASVINYRIYVREYPGKGKDFLKVFTGISLLFFAFVVLPGFFISHWRF
ncbi:MAG: hypothetical protein IK125_08705 [Lachnospiraceae bacterium]|nr:hypothetical protein [Lachnospiraceae bacterium]